MDAVVVGVDGSPGGRAALSFAAHEAALRGARLRIVSVAAGSAERRDAAGALRAHAQRACRDALEQAKGLEPDLAWKTSIREGQAATVLVDEARDAALLVVGSRGSVGQQRAQHASCPVAIVPRPQ